MPNDVRCPKCKRKVETGEGQGVFWCPMCQMQFQWGVRRVFSGVASGNEPT